MQPTTSHVIIASLAILLAATGAFNSHIPRITSDLNIQPTSSSSTTSRRQHQHQHQSTTKLNSWLTDAFQFLGLDLTLEKLNFNPKVIPQQPITTTSDKQNGPRGTVICTATKPYHPQHSKPVSEENTTRKESSAAVRIAPDGVRGDYNHYRTNALGSTPDRAVSILTTDILKMLRSGGWEAVSDGDLGENIYIDGIDYRYFLSGGETVSISDQG